MTTLESELREGVRYYRNRSGTTDNVNIEATDAIMNQAADALAAKDAEIAFWKKQSEAWGEAAAAANAALSAARAEQAEDVDKKLYALLSALNGATGIFFVGSDNEWCVRVDKTDRAPSPPAGSAQHLAALIRKHVRVEEKRGEGKGGMFTYHVVSGVDAAAEEIAGVSGVPEGCVFCGRPVGGNQVYDEANGETACKTCGDAEAEAQKREDILAALKSYSQADPDGVMCVVSRQAVDEVIILLAAAPER